MLFVFQLIQDEIKALVQLQNRQTNVPPQPVFAPTSVTETTNTRDDLFPIIPSDGIVLKNAPCDNDSLAAPVYTPVSSPSPARSGTINQVGERSTTVLSSGYGTLSAWGTGLDPARSPRRDWEDGGEKEKHQWVNDLQEDTETAMAGYQQKPFSQLDEPEPSVNQQEASG